MNRKFLISAAIGFPLLLNAIAPSAHADVIRVIQDDGSVAEVEIKAPAPAPVEEVAPPVATQRAPEPAPMPVPEPPQEAVFEPNLERVPVESLRPELTPQPEEEEKAVSYSAASDAPIGDAYTWPPIPMRKPAGARYAAPDAYAPSRADMAKVQDSITKDVALAIALENGAPAARSVKVLPRKYEGRSIFVVQFRTEDGLYDMLVDRASGEIIERKF